MGFDTDKVAAQIKMYKESMEELVVHSGAFLAAVVSQVAAHEKNLSEHDAGLEKEIEGLEKELQDERGKADRAAAQSQARIDKLVMDAADEAKVKASLATANKAEVLGLKKRVADLEARD